jgi:uncharacterized Zn finger protein (UPF0148 family)
MATTGSSNCPRCGLSFGNAYFTVNGETMCAYCFQALSRTTATVDIPINPMDRIRELERELTKIREQRSELIKKLGEGEKIWEENKDLLPEASCMWEAFSIACAQARHYKQVAQKAVNTAQQYERDLKSIANMLSDEDGLHPTAGNIIKAIAEVHTREVETLRKNHAMRERINALNRMTGELASLFYLLTKATSWEVVKEELKKGVDNEEVQKIACDLEMFYSSVQATLQNKNEPGWSSWCSEGWTMVSNEEHQRLTDAAKDTVWCTKDGTYVSQKNATTECERVDGSAIAISLNSLVNARRKLPLLIEDLRDWKKSATVVVCWNINGVIDRLERLFS